jgi:ornithine cyclodeaminase
MKILVLDNSVIEKLLGMSACIGEMEAALAALARNQAHNPLRMIVRPPTAKGLLGLMPAYVEDERAFFGLKAIGVFHQNRLLGKDSHQGVVCLFDGETGEPLAFMNASAITAIRTAAVSAVATKVLARHDASDLAIIGCGVQASSHLAAMSLVRNLKRVRVASRNVENTKKFAARNAAHYSFPIDAVSNVEEAMRGADIIVTVTSSSEPITRREWIAAGAHINAIGASTPTAREIDAATVASSKFFVDRRESTANEAGEYLLAAKDGVIGPSHIITEIGEILIGEKSGRTAADEITLFKSLGLAVEDLASAKYLYRRAKELNEGKWVEF